MYSQGRTHEISSSQVEINGLCGHGTCLMHATELGGSGHAPSAFLVHFKGTSEASGRLDGELYLRALHTSNSITAGSTHF